MEWFKVYELIERLYLKLETVNKYDINGSFEYEIASISVIQNYFTKEIKNLMLEEKLGYNFNQGIFTRKGYTQTSKSINNVMSVLGDQKLNKTRKHYIKAIEYFTKYSPKIAKNFDVAIRNFQGSGIMQAPAPIIESIIKIYGYRDSGSSIAHAIDKGLKLSEKEAKLVIALTANYITYFYSLLNNSEEEEIPFL